MTYVFYNPQAGNGCGRENAEKLKERLEGDIFYLDITEFKAKDIIEFAREEDRIVIAGGDGTLNRLINDLEGTAPGREVYYFPSGSGNDFMSDVKEAAGEDGLVLLNPYIQRLPTVTVNGTTRSFLNGIGYGIDGYCCEVGDELREKGKKANYTAIAIKGLLGRFQPRCAFITVDGKEMRFENVWLAPTMNGRYYGGGMMVAPGQDRRNADGTISLVVMHCKSKLKTLTVFPSIFKGEHIKHEEMVTVMSGREISVAFDRPTALQIDGETVRNVTSYSARSAGIQSGEKRNAVCAAV